MRPGELSTPAARAGSDHPLAVRAPFRLDLTVSALRRLSTNVVDVLTAEGAYLRALAGAHGPVVVRVRQAAADRLSVAIEGEPDGLEPLASARPILGTEV